MIRSTNYALILAILDRAGGEAPGQDIRDELHRLKAPMASQQFSNTVGRMAEDGLIRPIETRVETAQGLRVAKNWRVTRTGSAELNTLRRALEPPD